MRRLTKEAYGVKSASLFAIQGLFKCFAKKLSVHSAVSRVLNRLKEYIKWLKRPDLFIWTRNKSSKRIWKILRTSKQQNQTKKNIKILSTQRSLSILWIPSTQLPLFGHLAQPHLIIKLMSFQMMIYPTLMILTLSAAATIWAIVRTPSIGTVSRTSLSMTTSRPSKSSLLCRPWG